MRILRVARFAARFAALGFQVADETLDLMRAMVAAGEVDALVPERVWQEMAKALGRGAALPLLRGPARLRRPGPPAAGTGPPVGRAPTREMAPGDRHRRARHAGARHGRAALPDPEVRFAALCHDLGKGTTPAAILAQPPRSRGAQRRAAGSGLRPLAGAQSRTASWPASPPATMAWCTRSTTCAPATILILLEGPTPSAAPSASARCSPPVRRTSAVAPAMPSGPIPRARPCADSWPPPPRSMCGAIAAAAPEPRLIPERIRRARIAAIRQVRAGS